MMHLRVEDAAEGWQVHWPSQEGENENRPAVCIDVLLSRIRGHHKGQSSRSSRSKTFIRNAVTLKYRTVSGKESWMNYIPVGLDLLTF